MKQEPSGWVMIKTPAGTKPGDRFCLIREGEELTLVKFTKHFKALYRCIRGCGRKVSGPGKTCSRCRINQ